MMTTNTLPAGAADAEGAGEEGEEAGERMGVVGPPFPAGAGLWLQAAASQTTIPRPSRRRGVRLVTP